MDYYVAEVRDTKDGTIKKMFLREQNGKYSLVIKTPMIVSSNFIIWLVEK
jgi:hypothetical protein